MIVMDDFKKVRFVNDEKNELIRSNQFQNFDPLKILPSNNCRSGNEKENLIPSRINYRLLYRLTEHHRERNNVPEESKNIWMKISNDYNFITFSDFRSDDLKKFWLKMPSMLKRKMLLESSEQCSPESLLENEGKKLRKSGKNTKTFKATQKIDQHQGKLCNKCLHSQN